MRRITSSLLSLPLALAALPAGAQGWSQLPNGEFGYTVSYSTSAVFQCLTTFLRVGTCVASGNSVTLERDGATMTLAFTGVSDIVTATNTGEPASLGTITTTFGGEGTFRPPELASPNATLIRFDGSFVSTSPTTASRTFVRRFLPRSFGLITFGGPSYLALSVTPPPSPTTYDLVLFDHIPHPTFRYDAPQSVDLTTSVAVVPEPGTWALVATGMAALALLARRRRAA